MNGDTTVLPATAIAVVVSRGKHTSLEISVAAQIPVKRKHVNDTVQFVLEHYEFMEDRRYLSHLDALLGRLAPLSCIHLGCTETAEPSIKANVAADRKAQQVADLLERIANSISTRSDLADTTTMDYCDLTNIYRSLPTIPDSLPHMLQHLLSEQSFLAYRGAVVSELSKKSMELLLHGQGLVGKADTTLQTCQWSQGVLSSHLVLDRTAAETIHLLPPPHVGAATVMGGHKSNNSLYGILNQCKTPMGSRELMIWLRQPLVDLNAILQRQTAVGALVNNSLGRDRLRDEGLTGMTGVDLDKLAARLSQYKVTNSACNGHALEVLYKMYILATKQIPILLDALIDATNNDDSPILLEAASGLERCLAELVGPTQLTGLAETIIDLDMAPREYMVKASFDDRLGELSEELNQTIHDMEDCHANMTRTWQSVSGQTTQVRLEESDNGLEFRLPDANSIKILQSSLGNQVSVTKVLKNGTYFVTKELSQLGEEKRALMDEYESVQQVIVGQCMESATTYAPVLERLSALVSELDILASLAHVAAYNSHGYCKPEMTDSEDDGFGIELKQARHPCVELQEGVEFIPNDISLVFGESSFLLVTGPNMGGKSTYIRSLGAIVTLAQIGSYVPCQSAKINIVHHILARVGAGDAQDRGISTFMAEMLESSAILNKATKRSLIIIDELGRGTSTYDGYGLASAISDYIVQRVGCMSVFATHFHELTAMEQEHAQVKNCHVSATTTEAGLSFLYHVKDGPCLESFGIQVAEMAQVPQAVIVDAKRRAKELEKFEYRKKSKASLSTQESFRAKFKAIPFDTLSVAEKRRALQELVGEVQ